ncbi:capsular biosynthesis protein CpsI [Marinococcus halophilus]|uniref:NAD-dependent epimerase n=1 Tax=Marinococcus halophilus TaxID=1371 RepID=A0A510Y597_MARHA|nr:NAD-dependent epimerase [Marinococcus halophilus]OZT81747.1 capsular biosynthesis protein CpsI [Marinococcus halophilus]GEK57707.1 NAD-dependent epimerase [Marinococcus halophilus]
MILVTGSNGFVGMHTAERLLKEGYEVVGVDNNNDYYDVNLKYSRQERLEKHDDFHFHEIDLADTAALQEIFNTYTITAVINLAAQAGVRYSLERPDKYIQSNIVGFSNILEMCRHHQVEHLIYASSSSVYGANKKMPFSPEDGVNHPVSLYAATKKSNELLAHTYSHLYDLPTTGLRFFTVYGTLGRPDMAYFKFANKIVNGEPIQVYNNGDMMRDFTYIDDIVEGIVRLIPAVPAGDSDWDAENPDPSTSYAPYQVFNIGNNQPVALMKFIETLEKHLGMEARKEYLPMQPGDVQATYANIDSLQKAVGFKPVTSLDEGIGKFVEWYKDYYPEYFSVRSVSKNKSNH